MPPDPTLSPPAADQDSPPPAAGTGAALGWSARGLREIRQRWQTFIGQWRRQRPGWLQLLLYGSALGIGVFLLNGLDYAFRARLYPGDVYLTLLALIFLGLGIWVGMRLVHRSPASPEPTVGNPAAQASLGISDRELEVLQALAKGQANKEIARRLDISPNTVKTHISRLYEKLGSSNRTEAVHRARSLGILP